MTNLGQSVQDGLTGGIGFWHNKNGQALINAFNGGPDSMALSSWLVTCFRNLFRSVSGVGIRHESTPADRWAAAMSGPSHRSTGMAN